MKQVVFFIKTHTHKLFVKCFVNGTPLQYRILSLDGSSSSEKKAQLAQLQKDSCHQFVFKWFFSESPWFHSVVQR